MEKQDTYASKQEKYVNATKDVLENGLSCRKAAKKWGLTRTALQDRLNGKVEYHRCKGPAPVLTKAEEDEFTDWLINLSNRGFGPTKTPSWIQLNNFWIRTEEPTLLKTIDQGISGIGAL